MIVRREKAETCEARGYCTHSREHEPIDYEPGHGYHCHKVKTQCQFYAGSVQCVPDLQDAINSGIVIP